MAGTISDRSSGNKQWFLQEIDGLVYVILGGIRIRSFSGEEFPHVSAVGPGARGSDIKFKFGTLKAGRDLQRSQFNDDANELCRKFKNCETNREFMNILTGFNPGIERKKRKPPDSRNTSTSQESVPERQHISTVLDAKPKLILNKVDEAIQKKCVGSFRVHIDYLKNADGELRVRPIQRAWVNHLKAQIQDCPTKHVTVLPVVVKDITDVEDFSRFSLLTGEYTEIYVLGGNHIVQATKEILHEFKDDELLDTISKCPVEVYVGLTTQEARRLGTLHNQRTETQKMTFQDEVRLARRILVERSDGSMGDEPPDVIPPDLKTTIKTQLGKDHLTSQALGPIFSLAKLDGRCWEQLEIIFKNFDAKASAGASKRRISGEIIVPSIEKTPFMKMQGLSSERKYHLLRDVADFRMNLTQAGVEAENLKKLDQARSDFCHIKKCSTWKEAQRKFPNHARDEVLRQYLPHFNSNNLRGNPIPIAYRSFVQSLEEDDEEEDEDWRVYISIKKNGEQVIHDKKIKDIKKRYERKILKELKALPKSVFI